MQEIIQLQSSPINAHTWHVQYKDGTVIGEYSDDRPDGRGFAEVDATQIETLGLSGLHHVAIPDGASPVFFRRRRIELDPNSDEQKMSTAHCIGWKSDKSESYLFIFEDGSSLMTSDFNAV